MNMKLLCCAVLGVLVFTIAGCSGVGMNDAMWANDVTKQQEQGRMNRKIPEATELPPGLGEDLPEPKAAETPESSTQPITRNQ